MEIKIPHVMWSLGDGEQTTQSGVTVRTRPLYYCAKADGHYVRVGAINPDYAEPLMTALDRAARLAAPEEPQ